MPAAYYSSWAGYCRLPALCQDGGFKVFSSCFVFSLNFCSAGVGFFIWPNVYEFVSGRAGGRVCWLLGGLVCYFVSGWAGLAPILSGFRGRVGRLRRVGG